MGEDPTEKYDWDQVVEFHGHVCPGLAFGFRAAREALRALGIGPAQDEELVGMVEHDACGVDAFQMLTGCTLGNGSLMYHDLGKPAYSLAQRGTGGQSVRVVVRSPDWEDGERLRCLGQLIRSGEAGERERREYDRLRDDYIRHILSAPASEFISVSEKKLDLPERAQIFPSVICHRCGEEVMEPRARVRDGQAVCLPCATEYACRW